VGPDHLFTVAQAVFLRLGQLKPRHCGIDIVNSHNAVVGEICGKAKENFRDHALAHVNKHYLYEFIALSLLGLSIPHVGEERSTRNCAHGKELGWVFSKN
jgi:hypothetical protein